jgi:hypothetical protein
VSLFVLSPEIDGRDEVEVVNWAKNTRNDVNVLNWMVNNLNNEICSISCGKL